MAKEQVASKAAASVLDDRQDSPEFKSSMWNQPTDPNNPFQGGWTGRKSYVETWVPLGFMMFALAIALFAVLTS